MAGAGVLEKPSIIERSGFGLLLTFVAAIYVAPAEWIAGAESLRLALVTSAGALGLMVLSRLGRHKGIAIGGAPGWALIGLTGLSALSIGWSLHPEDSRYHAIEMAKFVALFVTMVNLINTKRRLWLVCAVIVACSLFPSIGGINWHFVGEDMVEGYRTRWYGIYGDPNRLAMSLVLILPLAIAFTLRKTNAGWLRVVAAVAVVCALWAIVLTHSRGGALGLAVAATAWILKERSLGKTGVMAVAFLGLVVLAPSTFWNRTETMTSFEDDHSAMGRVYAWEVAANISADRPLLGSGAGTFLEAWPFYAPPEATRFAYGAHNIFIQVMAELGIIGFALFLVFLSSAMARLHEASWDEDQGWMNRALFAGMAGYLITNLFAGFLLTSHLYLAAGLALCAWRVQSAESRASAMTLNPKPIGATV